MVYLFSFYINKKYLFPFLIPIFDVSSRLLIESIKEKLYENNNININDEHSFVFLFTFINSISYITIAIFNIFFHPRKYSLYFRKKEMLNKIYLFLMSIIFVLYLIIKGYSMNNKTMENNLYILFFISLLNEPLLQKQFYKHHLVSINMAGIGLIIILVIFIFENINNNLKYNYIYDILLLIVTFFYSINLCSFTYLSCKYEKPYKYLLFIGIFTTLLTTIGYILLSLINNSNLSYIINIFNKCDNNNKICFGDYIFKIIIIFILFFFLKTCIIYTLNNLSPSYLALSYIISSLIYYIIKAIQSNDNNMFNIIFNIFGYLIILIAALIFSEIIICNFCGINEGIYSGLSEGSEI